MQQRHHLLRLMKGGQAEITNYFVVWWILFEYSSFDHFLIETKSKIVAGSYMVLVRSQ